MAKARLKTLSSKSKDSPEVDVHNLSADINTKLASKVYHEENSTPADDNALFPLSDIIIVNSIGPNTVPCGTPDIMGIAGQGYYRTEAITGHKFF